MRILRVIERRCLSITQVNWRSFRISFRARMSIAMREIGVERSFAERDSQSGFTKKGVFYVRIVSAGAAAALRHGGQGGSARSRVGTSAGSIRSGMIGSSLRAEPAR